MSKYQFKTTPYAHQKVAIRRLLKQGYGGALIMEPRTGKTKTVIDWLSILHQLGKLDAAVIVAPNRVLGVWVQEAYLHSPRPLNVQVWDRAARKQGAPIKPLPGVLNLLIVNYEAFGVPGRKTKSGRQSRASGRLLFKRQLKAWAPSGRTAMVLDESHKIKSPSGRAANLLVDIGSTFNYRAILTGTPLTKAKRTYDIYMQWRFLNPGRFNDLPTVAEFKSRYGRWIEKNGYPKYLGPRNLPELHRRMRQDAFIIRRDECFDLPPREDLVEFVTLKESASVYQQMAKQMVAEIEEGVYSEAPLKIVQALRLSQITSGFVTDDEGNMRRLGYEKFERLIELLEDRWELEQKIVVVARWKADLDLIADYGEQQDVPTFQIRGKIKRAVSDQAILDFRHLEGPGLMVLQPDAAALGIDLSTASQMVWYSHTPSWVNFTQCCDRIALSRSSTTFTHLVARNSVDELLLSTLAGDGDIHRAIMSNPGELVNGTPLDLDDHSRLQGIGSFQFKGTKEKK